MLPTFSPSTATLTRTYPLDDRIALFFDRNFVHHDRLERAYRLWFVSTSAIASTTSWPSITLPNFA